MTTLLLSEILSVWSQILIALINIMPAFIAVYLLFWFIRSLLFKD